MALLKRQRGGSSALLGGTWVADAQVLVLISNHDPHPTGFPMQMGLRLIASLSWLPFAGTKVSF